MTVKVDVKDFKAFLKKYKNTLVEDIKKATVKAVVKNVPKLVENTPIDTGEMASSWDYD